MTEHHRTHLSPRAAYDSGLIARPDQLLEVRRDTIADGDARGGRTVSVRPLNGLAVSILLDRGMDIGGAWYAGTPVSWMSAVGDCRPGRSDADQGWLDGWSGGLLTTCGLRNVGVPSDGHGQHGNFTDLAAFDVMVRRYWLPDGEAAVEIAGVLTDAETNPELQITGPGVGLLMRVSWDRSTLPRLHTWRRRTPRSYVMSIEPANCGLGGRAADRAEGRAPFLAPGEERTTSLTVVVEPLVPVR
ncbi:hypothetical protein Vqi01_54760 [Micromonospora qiuiae]|uniref:DUF4432 domain-containing protein n=1 Tax=Micromonospora qiuiae TaxID=502268 RepID=A0ABQ4JLG5_9ACTN|nr:DUF4432 family protein [Micromonospora qiuiae]GIJ30314.1 hypothetical protein Vqi01_54760 [Micromonospora qiuiae]